MVSKGVVFASFLQCVDEARNRQRSIKKRQDLMDQIEFHRSEIKRLELEISALPCPDFDFNHNFHVLCELIKEQAK